MPSTNVSPGFGARWASCDISTVIDSEQITECPGCHRMTKTVGGRSTSGWFVKVPGASRVRRRYKSSFWDDGIFWGLWELLFWFPGTVLAIAGLLLDLPALLIAGGCIIGLRVAGGLAASWW